MCDAYTSGPLLSSVLFWTLSLIPSKTLHYVGLGAATASILIYAAQYNHPATRHARLNTAISATTEIMERAKSQCRRDQLDLIEAERRLFQCGACLLLDLFVLIIFFRAKLCASQMQCCLLEARDGSWKIYFEKIRAIAPSLHRCESLVREIQTSALVGVSLRH
jgi:hypothetical protein